MSAEVNAPGSPQWWRDRYQQRLASRGRGLTIDGICAAALAILDRDGLNDLTMRRVADELGTGPASLYRHVASREELLVEVVDRVLGEVSAPDAALPWRDAVYHLAHDLRRALLSHRAVALAAARGPFFGPNAMRLRELFWQAMDRDGCDPQFAVQTFFTIVHFVVCSALFGVSSGLRGGQPSGLADLLDVLPARRYPTVLKFSDYGDKPDPEYDFDFGLRALLDGLTRDQA
jgi:AcrR family transcriptional regulator